MALKIWLPLNKDFRNQGLSDVAVTNVGATVSAGGKIGAAYSNTTDGNGVNLVGFMDELKTYSTYSMCAWVYMSDSATSHSSTILSSGNWNTSNGNMCFGFYSYSGGYSKLLIPNKGSWSTSINLSPKVQLNTWYHVAVTYDGTRTVAYINGTQVGTSASGGICENSNSTNVKVGAATYTNGFTLKGKLNDVRVYDHALSTKEVKELSKGLILNYKLSVEDITDVARDCSGFGNDGTYTALTSASINSGSARYDKSITFTTGASKYILTPTIDKTDIQNSFTVSWWSKTANMHGKMAWGGDTSGNRLNLYPSTASTSGFCWNTGDGGKNPVKTDGGALIKVSPYNDSNWHHYAMVGDGTNGKLYIDGEYKGKAVVYKPLTPQKLYISGWDTSTSYRWDGQVSDFRLYSTALSAEDIAELYHTGASVDNHGNFFCGELKEN